MKSSITKSRNGKNCSPKVSFKNLQLRWIHKFFNDIVLKQNGTSFWFISILKESLRIIIFWWLSFFLNFFWNWWWQFQFWFFSFSVWSYFIHWSHNFLQNKNFQTKDKTTKDTTLAFAYNAKIYLLMFFFSPSLSWEILIFQKYFCKKTLQYRGLMPAFPSPFLSRSCTGFGEAKARIYKLDNNV